MYQGSVFVNVLGYEMVSQGNKIWNRVFTALCDNFRHCEIFFLEFLARPGELFRRREVFTPPDSFYGVG